MSRRVYVWDKKTQSMVEVRRIYREPVAPAIRCDTINEYCHGTGKHYESRSERDRDLKALGVTACSEREFWSIKPSVDNEKERQAEIEQNLLETYYDLRENRSNELTEQEKAICKETDERLFRKP